MKPFMTIFDLAVKMKQIQEEHINSFDLAMDIGVYI
jgi:hypothetical protein